MAARVGRRQVGTLRDLREEEAVARVAAGDQAHPEAVAGIEPTERGAVAVHGLGAPVGLIDGVGHPVECYRLPALAGGGTGYGLCGSRVADGHGAVLEDDLIVEGAEDAARDTSGVELAVRERLLPRDANRFDEGGVVAAEAAVEVACGSLGRRLGRGLASTVAGGGDVGGIAAGVGEA